jgi:hypothetical protein
LGVKIIWSITATCSYRMVQHIFGKCKNKLTEGNSIEEHILDTSAEKQLSLAATHISLTQVLKK